MKPLQSYRSSSSRPNSHTKLKVSNYVRISSDLYLHIYKKERREKNKLKNEQEYLRRSQSVRMYTKFQTNKSGKAPKVYL